MLFRSNDTATTEIYTRKDTLSLHDALPIYPAVEVAHILGFVVLVGSAFMFDLRLLGLSRALPVAGMADHLLRWARWSLVAIVPTGALMFSAHATEFAFNPAFRLKLILITAAGLNAAVFHRVPFRSVGDWDTEIGSPPAARAAAILSLALWTGVITCGRLIAYF